MIVRNLLKLILLTITTAIFLFSCEKEIPDHLTIEERRWLNENSGKIRVAPDPAWPPYEYIDEEGKFQGITADTINLIAKKLKFSYRIIRAQTWEELQDMVKTGEAEILPGVSRSPQREKFLTFTTPFNVVKVVIITRKITGEKISLDNIGKRSLAVTAGYGIHHHLINNYSHLNIVPVSDVATGLGLVARGKIEAMAVNLATASYYIEKERYSNLTVAGSTDYTYSISIGSRKDLPILNSILQKGLDLISIEEREQIRRKWIKFAYPEEEIPIAGWFIFTLLLPFTLLLILVTRRYRIPLVYPAGILIFFVASILLLHSLVDRIHEEEKTTGDISSEVEKPPITVGALRSFLPVDGMDSEGNHIGISSGYLRVIAEKTRRRTKVLFYSSPKELKKALQLREIDLALSLPENSLDSNDFIKSLPYFTVQSGIVMREKSRSYTLEQLKGKRILIYHKHPLLPALTGRYGEIFTPAESRLQSLQSLSFLHADASIIEIPIALQLIEKEGLPMLKLASKIDEKYTLHIFSRKEYSWLIKAIDEILNNLSPGEKEAINSFWVKAQKRYDISLKPLLFPLVMLAVALLLLFVSILSWNRMLRRRVAKQTGELTETRDYLNAIFDSMPSVLVGVDAKGTVTHWNRAVEEITGVDESEALGKELYELSSIFYPYRETISSVLESGTPRILHREKFGKKGDQFRDVTLYPIRTEESKGVVLRMDDMTDVEKKEDELRQMQKMDTVGTLAGGIAHDFNNVLAGINGTLSLIKFRNSQGVEIAREEMEKYLSTMERSGERAKEMVQQLLSLSRKEKTPFRAINLHDIISAVMGICRNSFHKSIKLELPDPSIPAFVNGDPGQLEQAILNICVNASHAMTTMRGPEDKVGGILSISLESLFADPHFISIHPSASEKPYWNLSIKDTGVGIDRKIKQKIFDPFFTTKKKGKGTGLGLSMVYTIITSHDGFIDFYSEVGRGTSFHIYLPILEGSPERELKEEVAPPEMGEGLILVVDDEEIIRETAKAILEELGYRVIVAQDGVEGVEIFEKYRTEIDLILMDLVMPRMSGREAYLKIKVLKEDVKVILGSGFRRDREIEEILARGVKQFIQKPYTVRKLAAVVSQVMKS